MNIQAKDVLAATRRKPRRLARGRTYLQKAITDRLRQAGEISIAEDGASACEVLLGALRIST